VRPKGTLFARKPKWFESLFQTGLKPTEALHIAHDPHPDHSRPPGIRKCAEATDIQGEGWFSVYGRSRDRRYLCHLFREDRTKKFQGEMNALGLNPAHPRYAIPEVLLYLVQDPSDLIRKLDGDE
jgi:hypothetical protein